MTDEELERCKCCDVAFNINGPLPVNYATSCREILLCDECYNAGIMYAARQARSIKIFDDYMDALRKDNKEKEIGDAG